MRPQAFRMVWRNQSTGSAGPRPPYSGAPASSASRCASYAALTGNTSSSASAGRGTNASSSGSVIEYTSCMASALLRPSRRRSPVITSGFASSGMKAGREGSAGGSGCVIVVEAIFGGICDV
ncbi:hypothetical protein UCREL1_2525 [Eutypa lata UCREL1]|uniref:Uncharacterized protein n=1 Tax=Eutypa lata (strain UCR-EL1) TaxID=1287681 RepID=M7SV24_EUTLA|nr:hypothetical protein UCREL1_2525 [Eutypa lata UCREL1]